MACNHEKCEKHYDKKEIKNNKIEAEEKKNAEEAE